MSIAQPSGPPSPRNDALHIENGLAWSTAFNNTTALKRKHTETFDAIPLGGQLTIDTHPSLPSSYAQQLVPKLLISRSSLPLAYINPCANTVDNLTPRLFSADIEILDRDPYGQQHLEPKILIVQSAKSNKLYAVERAQIGLYALCLLCSWVTIQSLERLQSLHRPLICSHENSAPEFPRDSVQEWWRAAAVKHHDQSWGKLGDPAKASQARKVHLSLRRPTTTIESPYQVNREFSPSAVPAQSKSPPTVVAAQPCQAPEELFNIIKSQYQEALYASRTSLAYFAKGPLSRARALLFSKSEPGYNQSSLAQFLRSCILPLKSMDIKYRETLPSIVKDLPFVSLSDGEGASIVAAVEKKTRKSKKLKAGKNGLYPGEDVSITRWWLSRDAADLECDSTDVRELSTKAALLEQRTRETQMQIILALETLALECSGTISSANQDPEIDDGKADVGTQGKCRKPRKPQDLNTLLDLLADRLSIWQSMDGEEAKAPGTNPESISQQESVTSSKATGSDVLRQFCIDVILPFYGARLPALTASICQKLGGSKAPSPNRPPMVKMPTDEVSLKPGTLLQRQRRKPRRTLERVLTGERSSSQRPIPSLLRSTTDPDLPRMKREESDTSLSIIPLNRVAMHKRYGQREVDLQAAAHANETKLKNKAKVDQELRNAISAMKRPNPRMAVKELVEDAEKRAAGSQTGKVKNIKQPFAQSVQITATPSKSRHKNSYPSLPRLKGPRVMTDNADPEINSIPPSSISRIADSARKERGEASATDSSFLNERIDALPIMAQTPSKDPSKILDYSSKLSTSMIPKLRNAELLCSATPSKATKGRAHLPERHSQLSSISNNQETPSKRRAFLHPQQQGDGRRENIVGLEESSITSLQRQPPWGKANMSTLQHSSQEQKVSIYASLGWDNDIDDLA